MKRYLVSLDITKSFYVPYMCPVCGEKTHRPMELGFLNSSAPFSSQILRKQEAFWTFRFYCCHSKRKLSHFVFGVPEPGKIRLYFRNPQYAEAFSKMNGIEMQEATLHHLENFRFLYWRLLILLSSSYAIYKTR